MWVYIWLGITALALIVEFLTTEMVSVWFIGGGLIAMILAIFKVQWYVHVPVFIVVSLLCMLLFRKLLLKKFDKPDQKTNAETVIGKEFALLSPIKFNEAGSIKINDVIWSAVGETQTTEIEQGKIVIVIGLKGNKYIVKEKK